jgi:hypothetical protein
MQRPESRRHVDFQVYLSWQDRQGGVHRAAGRCVDLSASGARIKTGDPLAAQSVVVLHGEKFGRIGHATVRYCRRTDMKYEVGLHFSTALTLGGSLRKEILDRADGG